MIFKLNRPKSSTEGFKKEIEMVPLLPLRDIVIFPHIMVPLFIGRERSIAALEHAMGQDSLILLCTQKDAKKDDPSENDIYRVGVLGNILQLLRLPDGTVKALIEGKKRAEIRHFLSNPNYFIVEVEEIVESYEHTTEVEALMRTNLVSFEQYIKLNKKIPQEVLQAINTLTDPGWLADNIASHLAIKIEEKQPLLEIVHPVKRLEKVLYVMQREIEVLQIEGRIKSRVKKQMEKTQKEYYLNEQIRAIQKEMGEKDDLRSEIQDLEKRIKRKRLSSEASTKMRHELKKLKLMSPMSAEATVVRNYIDWVLALPWYEKTKDKLDIVEAERILNEDHYGLEKPKERILEYLAVQSLVKKMKGPILCLVGPPGVGKTSLAKSVARALGRNFVRLSLGGVRDEAEIRGHRRTYIGALPGKIIQSLRKAKTNNPVFCLDEVDKMSTDFRGDPSAALLEVLDPEQNNAFNDHYLDMDYDLSEVMFITTANTLYSIPLPLQDRMEIIRIPGYTEVEKLNIAQLFLIPKQRQANGLTPENIEFSENAILNVIRQYTREAGVRNLEREIAGICRKVAREVAKEGLEHKVRVSSQTVSKYLGVPKFRFGRSEEKDEVGLTTGLAWTEFGGELLLTEVVILPGRGKLIITGKLGEVMQESAQAAMSYVRSRASDLGLPLDFYRRVDIHIHIPEGAIPKDGPSAGITLATTLVSALLKIPVHRDIAMTGEITLRGRVLPIGGLKEKIIAAHRGQIKTVLIPKDNEKDLKDIPPRILKAVEVIPVEHMDEVLLRALVLEKPETLFKPRPDADQMPSPAFLPAAAETPGDHEIHAH
ncbi:endopeptidase La [Desulfobacca acetoxidans]|uniref:Lon protease n=1 Tax=Desulfobacca acetoxidans (strain ATCC 700848 / DSM 11109 / ASRB2) TaxID=880072 RepID=F2NEW7_DESAR|nr:endopeptidase La [Desulfobacca acetoxidans]AEB08307.1 anti-sigma H sporulation factor, LonB [Desulfobacca acetoxidans DSM 11109]